MNLRQLEYFKTLAHLEHMTKSAEILNISQPSLSHSITELEKELGIQLFERKGRNIYLTKYGRLFLNYVENALNQLDKGKDVIQNLLNPYGGHISLSFVSPVGPVLLPYLLEAFKKNQLYENIQFTFHQNISTNIIQQLKNEEADLGICTKIDDEEISFTQIAEQRIVLITPKNHPLAVKEQVNLAETMDYPQIFFAKKSGLRFIIDKMLNRAQLTPQIRYEFEEEHTIIGFVAQNHGIAIIADSPLLKLYPVEVIPIDTHNNPRYLYLAHTKNRLLTPSAELFKNFILDQANHHFFDNKV